MKKSQRYKHVDAHTLFPELMRRLGRVRPDLNDELDIGKIHGTLLPGWKGKIVPPSPPDVSWLKTGLPVSQEPQRDVPYALTLIDNKVRQESVDTALIKLGHLVEHAATESEGLQKIKAHNYATVVLHTGFADRSTLGESLIHKYLALLAMEKRRLMFYAIIGPALHTLYNLEAFALSANLVINERDTDYLVTIFKKGFQDFNELFAPLLESLRIYR